MSHLDSSDAYAAGSSKTRGGHRCRSWRLEVARLQLWPEAPPPPPPLDLIHGWVHRGNERMLRRLLEERQPRCVVELGSWCGLCTTLLCEAAPRLAVFAVDLWDAPHLLATPSQREQYTCDAQAMAILQAGELHAAFLHNLWPHRTRVFPLRMPTGDGLAAIARLGAPVDLIYVDADHTYAAVLADLRASARLFPDALLCGDDWCWADVQLAVADFAHERGLRVVSHPRENWWWLRHPREEAVVVWEGEDGAGARGAAANDGREGWDA
ncbi:hypothetical protein EMIHUDRAFT_241782 [Emiliania huxleyi CCMP1516]|uniref:Class I SAM-dependent methyltransferase n=2 Tax=Emiliania huxleyi TaxID=2903 RepID=A0A0D3JBF0_EMIH1|nr:hypothetical protein EMIHUDRAFT_241782 [Emiliania huxleyi CCMP1516]EOD20835.1 hypothetical protein EMIHUDRAFT_241782 [Emiliania huxleyi CCMP1516]|eukprot:XP_005773264.1 hypothetical protein EMIHUDRAFT_241782 [Emiliania huxleyi CCMP1516]